MAEFLKPDNLNIVWASGGDRLYPGDTKYESGWGVEIPPRQYFNQIDYKQDQMLAHINQHGLPVWDEDTEYQAGKSYVQGSDGLIYKAVVLNKNVDPVGNIDGTWEMPFLSPEQLTQVATAAQSRAQTDNTVFISPLQLSNAFTGSNQILNGVGAQKLPGGIMFQWVTLTTTVSGFTTATFPIPFTSQVFCITATSRDQAATPTLRSYATLGSNTLSTVQVYTSDFTGTQVGVAVNIIAIGI